MSSTLNSTETRSLSEAHTTLVNIVADLQGYLTKAAESDGLIMVDRDHIEEHIRRGKDAASKVNAVMQVKGYYPA